MTDKEWKQFVRSLWRLTDDKTIEELRDIERKYQLGEATEEQVEKELTKTIDRSLKRKIERQFIDGFVGFLRKEEELRRFKH